MYRPISWSPMTPHHMFTEKRCWYLLSTVPWGLSRSHKWKFLVRQYLNCEFPNWWIGCGGAQNWPPQSSDLNPLEYHVWDCMEGMVYAHRVNTREELTPVNSQCYKKYQQRCSALWGYKFSGHASQKMHPSRWRTLQTIFLSVEWWICNYMFSNISQ